MKCPNCDHVSGKALEQCSNCGEVYDRELLESSQSAEFLVEWLNEKRAEGLFGANVHRRLAKIAQEELDEINFKLLAHLQAEDELSEDGVLEAQKILRLTEGVHVQVSEWVDEGLVDMVSGVSLIQILEDRMEELNNKLGQDRIPADEPTEFEIIDYALDSLEEWETNSGLAYGNKLKNELNKRRSEILYPPKVRREVSGSTRPSAKEDERKEVAPPAVIESPISTPVSPREPINWGKTWEQVVGAFVSGAVMRGILYLGAFMIVIPAGILVGRFWDTFSPLIQLAFLFSVPALFYGAGWFVRRKLNLRLAGGALTGIGALLLAADFVGIFQFGDQPLEPNFYWLIASLVSTAVYALNARQLKSLFFGYLTALGVVSLMMSLASIVGLQFAWILASILVSSLGISLLAGRLAKSGKQWNSLEIAYRRTTQFLFPATILAIPFISTNSNWPITFSLAMASVFYALNALNYPALIFAHASVWSTVAFAALLVISLSVPVEWFAIIFSIFSPISMISANAIGKRLTISAKLKKKYVAAIRNAGFIWTFTVPILFALNVTEHYWISALSLILVAANLAWWFFQFANPTYMLMAGLVFIAPYTLITGRILRDNGFLSLENWILAFLSLLGLTYLWIGRRLKSQSTAAAWIFSIAQFLAVVSMAGFFAFFSRAARAINANILLLVGSILIFALSFLIQRSKNHPSILFPISWISKKHRPSGYLWPAGVAAPILLWYSIDIQAAMANWAGVSLGFMALLYLALGQRFSKSIKEIRLPTHTLAYLIGAVSLLFSTTLRWELITNLLLLVALLAGYSLIYKRVFDVSATGILLIWPFQLLLNQTSIPGHAYSLAFAVLSSLIYLNVAFRLLSKHKKISLPLFILAYLLGGYSVVISMLGGSGVFTENLPLVAFLTPLLITGTQIYSLFRLRNAGFAWSSLLILTLAFAQGLSLFQIGLDYSSSAWIIFASLIIVGERRINTLSKNRRTAWLKLLQLPLKIGSFAYASLGLMLTYPVVSQSLAGIRPTSYTTTLWAHGFFVGILLLTSRMYKSRWPTFIEPVFSLLPVTLFFEAFGKSLLGVEV